MLVSQIVSIGASVMQQHDPPVWEPVQDIVERFIKPDRRHHWPLSPTFPLDIRFLRLNRNLDVPPHRPDHLEIVYVEQGEVGYEVGDRTCTLHPGDIIVVGDKILHRCLRTKLAHPDVHSTVLYFRPELVTSGSPFGDDLRYLLPFSRQNESFCNVIAAEGGIAGDVLTFLQRIRREMDATSDHARFAVRTYVRLILALIGNYYMSNRESRDTMMRSHDDLSRLKPVFEYISANLSESIRVENAARLAAMSPTYFMHYFRKTTGSSFVHYLNTLRVSRAQYLLAETDKSIAEISYEAGFCSQSYFGTVFRRFAGLTAFTYRTQSRAASGQTAQGS
jgi:AraC family transcriptional activator of pobA